MLEPKNKQKRKNMKETWFSISSSSLPQCFPQSPPFKTWFLDAKLTDFKPARSILECCVGVSGILSAIVQNTHSCWLAQITQYANVMCVLSDYVSRLRQEGDSSNIPFPASRIAFLQGNTVYYFDLKHYTVYLLLYSLKFISVPEQVFEIQELCRGLKSWESSIRQSRYPDNHFLWQVCWNHSSTQDMEMSGYASL